MLALPALSDEKPSRQMEPSVAARGDIQSPSADDDCDGTDGLLSLLFCTASPAALPRGAGPMCGGACGTGDSSCTTSSAKLLDQPRRRLQMTDSRGGRKNQGIWGDLHFDSSSGLRSRPRGQGRQPPTSGTPQVAFPLPLGNAVNPGDNAGRQGRAGQELPEKPIPPPPDAMCQAFVRARPFTVGAYRCG
ncbi:uncharacterized protein LY79DRAFT_551018, partial [Colletotrichum navitas]